MKRTSPSFVWCCQPRLNNFNNILFMNFYFSMLKWISYGTAEYFPVFNDITFLDVPLIYHKYAFSNTCINQQQQKMRKCSSFGTIPRREDVCIHINSSFLTVTIQLMFAIESCIRISLDCWKAGLKMYCCCLQIQYYIYERQWYTLPTVQYRSNYSYYRVWLLNWFWRIHVCYLDFNKL